MLGWWWWRKNWRPAVAADAAFVGTLISITTSRVISPQYMIWLLGTAAFCLLFKDTTQRRSTLLFLPALPLTQLDFPITFTALREGHFGPIMIVGLRDALLLAATVIGMSDLWRSTVTGRFWSLKALRRQSEQAQIADRAGAEATERALCELRFGSHLDARSVPAVALTSAVPGSRFDVKCRPRAFGCTGGCGVGTAGRSSDLERCGAIGRRVGVLESRCFVVPWDVVERSLGTMLPDGYKAFIEYFGPGRFSGELQYFTPGIESSGYELVHLVKRNHERWIGAPRFPDDTPPFPEPGGVLMFASIGDDATAQWRTRPGDPNTWGIVIDHGSLAGDLEFAGDFLDLVTAMLDEAREVDDLEYYPELMAVFVPGDGSVPNGARLRRLEPISHFATHGAA